ncbi:hypothetical protein [Litorilituus lipolyticus]|uniref:Uncharacterized protein n=1 Tax=Litorilituus lipolyticus TaxID=2491017 RepID=A0A502KS61_9GAMM|nr:hypothetical protein [Litorilituus lipolyticus]TPH14054.1 hypothetical protein EPA86_13185 [Litorilituus lipolyticus]
MNSRILYLLILTTFSFSSYSRVYFDSKFDFSECVAKVEQIPNQSCRFYLSHDYQISQGGLTRDHARKIQKSYREFFNSLTSKKDRLTFSYETIDYLANKNIIKKFISLSTYKDDPVLSVVIKILENEKGGYGIRLTSNVNETIELLSSLKNRKHHTNMVYTNQIESMFSAI